MSFLPEGVVEYSVDENDYLVVSQTYSYTIKKPEIEFSNLINEYMNGTGPDNKQGIKYKPTGGIAFNKTTMENIYSQALIGEKPIKGGHKKPSRRKTRKNRRKY